MENAPSSLGYSDNQLGDYEMSISDNVERLDKGSPAGSLVRGLHQEIIAAGAAVTLVAGQAGSLVLLDTAAGSIVTLPTPSEGLTFDFAVSVSVTSNSHIIGGAAGEFLLGGIQMMIDTTAVSEGQFLDGATHLTLTHNGTTTGGLIGTNYRFVGLNATQWSVTGLCAGSGTLATPATT
jgi:hypothetical protein